jgi:hypothetical protein
MPTLPLNGALPIYKLRNLNELKGRVYTHLKGRVYTHLKGRVYTHKPRNLNELKDSIRQEVLTIDQQLLARAMDHSKRRIEIAFKRMVVT